jgi:hypothetical protein
MIKRFLTLPLLLIVLAPSSGWAQGLGLGGRVGTLGLGGELAVGLTDRVVVRGGAGFMPYDPNFTFSDVGVSLSLPNVYNVGVDLYVNGAVRFGGGILFRSDDPTLRGDFDSPQEIGGTTYTPQELGTLTGVLDSSGRAPYVLVGFGRHTAAGVGLFLDLGLAFTGDPDVRLDAEGGTLSPDSNASFRSALDREAAAFEADMRGYLKLWPVLSLGVRFGAD